MQLTVGDWQETDRRIGANETVFAVGDVHGCLDQLEALEAVIARRARDGRGNVSVVYLGDYIDRGPDSIGVLDHLHARLRGDGVVRRLALAGNHDEYLRLVVGDRDLDFEFVRMWLSNGGMTTLAELDVPWYASDACDLTAWRARVRHALGPQRCELLNGFEYFAEIGDYVFVHAGIVPGIAPVNNEVADLLLIREEFLEAQPAWPHDFTVVHGHTPSAPGDHGHRVAVDSGAFFTGALTAVEIEDRRFRFVTAATEPASEWADAAAAMFAEAV